MYWADKVTWLPVVGDQLDTQKSLSPTHLPDLMTRGRDLYTDSHSVHSSLSHVYLKPVVSKNTGTWRHFPLNT